MDGLGYWPPFSVIISHESSLLAPPSLDSFINILHQLRHKNIKRSIVAGFVFFITALFLDCGLIFIKMSLSSCLKRMSSVSDLYLGNSMALGGTLALSLDGLLFRLAEGMPDFTVIFWIWGLFGVTTLILFIVKHGYNSISQAKRIGKIGVFAGLVWGATNLLISISFQQASIATALVILSANPLFCAIFSLFILKEQLKWRMILAGADIIGVLILIFYDVFANKSSGIFGILCVLGASVCQGLYFTLLKLVSDKYIDDPENEPDMLPCNFIAGFSIAIVSACLTDNLAVTNGHDWIILIADGVFALPISYSLLTLATTYVSATEVSLMTLLEILVGPLLVYAAGFEAPPLFSVYGGIYIYIYVYICIFICTNIRV
jgi:drug/metabolite transporter (DMT)-like permease